MTEFTTTVRPTLGVPMNLADAGLTLLLSLCLYPVVLGSISVNYSFLVIPAALILLHRKVSVAPPFVIFAMLSFGVIFVLSVLGNPSLLPYFERRAISFLLFMAMFAFVFVRLDDRMILALKRAIVLFSVVFSALAISIMVGDPVGALGYEAKDLVGSQRTGFIFVIAFWLLLLGDVTSTRWLRITLLLIVIAGLFLTFSRSSIVALVAGLTLYVIHSQRSFLTRPSARQLFGSLGMILVGAVAMWLLYQLFPIIFVFYEDRLLGLLDIDKLLTKAFDPASSEGQRVTIALLIFDYVAEHPFTGTGYLGVWALPETTNGSAHNQYLDVLLRTGVFGLLVYISLLFYVLKHLYRYERALFWSMTAVLTYGLVHETFKESQGALVLSFLLGMATSRRSQHAQSGVGDRV